MLKLAEAESMATAHLSINGKKAGVPAIREAVSVLRDLGHDLQVRVTWEYGDGLRYLKEAGEKNVACVIAGGGDGTGRVGTPNRFAYDTITHGPLFGLAFRL